MKKEMFSYSFLELLSNSFGKSGDCKTLLYFNNLQSLSLDNPKPVFESYITIRADKMCCI